jgi:hypothetical protein
LPHHPKVDASNPADKASTRNVSKIQETILSFNTNKIYLNMHYKYTVFCTYLAILLRTWYKQMFQEKKIDLAFQNVVIVFPNEDFWQSSAHNITSIFSLRPV